MSTPSMRLGIGSYTYTWAIGVPGHPPAQPLTAFDLLARARELQVGVVQFCDNLPLVRLSALELDRFQALATEWNLAVEIGTRGVQEANLMVHLELAQRLQAPFVRLVLDSPGHEPSLAEAESLLRPLVARYARAGVKLALENHDRFPAAALVQLVRALGAEHVGICLDTVNSFGALEGPEVVVPALAPYTLNLHVKDFVIQRVPSQMGFTVTGCAAGAGRLNLPWLLAHLQAVGRAPNAIIELWTPPADHLAATVAREHQWAVESVRNLRRFIPN